MILSNYDSSVLLSTDIDKNYPPTFHKRRHPEIRHENSCEEVSDLEIAEELYTLGMEYAEKEDYANSFRYIYESADRKYKKSMYYLGVFYRNGIGVPKSTEDAKKWFSMAASQGDEASEEAFFTFYTHERYKLLIKKLEKAFSIKKILKMAGYKVYDDKDNNDKTNFEKMKNFVYSAKEEQKWDLLVKNLKESGYLIKDILKTGDEYKN
jgi:hypothetical protein